MLLVPLLLLGAAACERGPTKETIRALHQQGRFEASIEPLREMIQSQPEDAEAHYLYGVALIQTGDSRVAVWSLRRAAEDPQWRLLANLQMAVAGVRVQNWESAIESAKKVLEEDPEHLLAHIVLGEAYLGEGKDPERALEAFEVVLDREPGSAPAMASRAAALLMLGRVDEASEALEELESSVSSLSPDPITQARLCATRAVLQAERGEVASSEEQFEACLERFPTQTVLIEPAISFFDQQGRRDRSTEILEKALDLEPAAQHLRRKLAERVSSDGDRVRAEAILKAGVEVEGKAQRAAAWTDLTNHYLGYDDVPSAIHAYEEALALSEDPPQLAILAHADLLARAGRHERALEVAKQLENEAYRKLIEARVHLDQGRPAEALARLDEVLPTWPNNAGARYYAARAAEQLGDFSRAIEEYRQSIRSAPEQTEAALRLAKLYLATGSLQNAWNSASQYFRASPEDPEGVRVLFRSAATSEHASLRTLYARLRPTPLWPVAIATRAETLAQRGGGDAALAFIEEVGRADLTLSRNAELLRAKVTLLLAAGRTQEARAAIDSARAADPASSAFREIEGLVLEGEGAAMEGAQAAYEGAVAVDPQNAGALEALGRLAEARGATEEALDFYDRASKAAPERSSPALRGARLAQRAGRPEDALRRYELLLREHPWSAEAALDLARLRLESGAADEATLELVERAVLFRGGLDAQKLLIEIHEARGETDRALEISRAIETGERVPPRKITPIEGS